MDILNRSGRISNVEDELNSLQQQKKQYISVIDLSEDEVETVMHDMTIIKQHAINSEWCFIMP